MCYSACISSDEGKLRLLVAEPTDDFWEEAGPASIMPWGCVGPGVQLDHHPKGVDRPSANYQYLQSACMHFRPRLQCHASVCFESGAAC